MKEMELLDKAMNVGYDMVMGEDKQIYHNDSNEIEDMIFIPDPELTIDELTEELIEYFESTEEYEKCANLRDSLQLTKVLNQLIYDESRRLDNI